MPSFLLVLGQTCPAILGKSPQVRWASMPVVLGIAPHGLGHGYPSKGAGLPFGWSEFHQRMSRFGASQAASGPTPCRHRANAMTTLL